MKPNHTGLDCIRLPDCILDISAYYTVQCAEIDLNKKSNPSRYRSVAKAHTIWARNVDIL